MSKFLLLKLTSGKNPKSIATLLVFCSLALAAQPNNFLSQPLMPAVWDTNLIWAGSATLRQIDIGKRLKGSTDDTFRLFTVQSAAPRMVLLFTDISTSPPMQWRCDTLEISPQGYYGARIGDVDRDGDNDLIYARSASPYYLFRRYWTGSIWAVEAICSIPGANWGMDVGDADNDGWTDDIIYSCGVTTSSRLYWAHWNGTSWDTTRLWSGDGRTIQGVAIGDFDTAYAGNEVVAVTAGSTTDGGRVFRLRWTGSTWDTLTLWKAPDNASFVEVAIGDFDASNPGKEIAVANGLGPGSTVRGAVIEIYGAGNNWNQRPIFTPTVSSNAWGIAIGDFLDANPGGEVVFSQSLGGPPYVVRAVYGSGNTWSDEIIFSMNGTSYSVLVDSNVNKHRTMNAEIAVTGNYLVVEIEQQQVTAPVITNVINIPRVPLSTQPVIVRAKIYDNNTPPLPLIDSVYYAVNDTSTWTWISSDSILISESLYFYTIPAQDTGSVVYFHIMAKNSAGARTVSPVFSYPVALEHSIYQIQYTTGNTSPDSGKWVHTKGIVTGEFDRYFYIEEYPGGAWHGLYIRRPQFADSLPQVAVGDSVEILGEIREFQQTTVSHIEYALGGWVQIVTSLRPLPCTTLLTIPQVTESLECALVRFNYVHFKATGNFNAWTTYYLYNRQETESIAVYIWGPPFTNIPGNPIPQGQLAAIGHIYQYYAVYELIPRSLQDFILIPEPTPPTLLLPPNGSTTTNRLPFFDWTDVPFGVEYQIQVSSDTTFGSPVIDTTVAISQFQTTVPLAYNTYYWRVRTKDEINRWSEWSVIWHFRIGQVTRGWVSMRNIPPEPSGKKPKSGSCMAGLDGKIYFLKASNTPDFYVYTPDTGLGSWQTLESLPKGTKPNNGKNPKKGASMASFATGNAVYVLRGNNTPGFWKYMIAPPESVGWRELAPIPLGQSGKKPKDASGMVWVTKFSTDYLFVMKGSKTDEFFLYNLVTDTWLETPIKPPPPGPSGKVGYKKGSCLTYDGRFVYVLKGVYGDFFKYDVEEDTWIQLTRYDYKLYPNSQNKSKKIGDGAGLQYWYGDIYLLKGGNTNEFWKYDLVTNNWMQMVPDSLWSIPVGASQKRVKGGGALVVLETEKGRGEGEIYAAKGNNTDEFYEHDAPESIFTITYHPSENIKAKKITSDVFNLLIYPNPTANLTTVRYTLPNANAVSLKLYNIAGLLVKSYENPTPTQNGTLFIDTKGLSSGVYILRFNSGDIRVTRKIVLEK
uniref:T9SS type A sorting domain-containing protein n=1 Tax=candidate division WOR-3 bacterium TaxID=2052148 RepID=A0A7C6A9V1_UNCW3